MRNSPLFLLQDMRKSCTVLDLCDQCQNNSTCDGVSDSGEVICGCPEDVHGEFCDDSEYFPFLHSNGLCTLSDMD